MCIVVLNLTDHLRKCLVFLLLLFSPSPSDQRFARNGEIVTETLDRRKTVENRHDTLPTTSSRF